MTYKDSTHVPWKFSFKHFIFCLSLLRSFLIISFFFYCFFLFHYIFSKNMMLFIVPSFFLKEEQLNNTEQGIMSLFFLFLSCKFGGKIKVFLKVLGNLSRFWERFFSQHCRGESLKFELNSDSFKGSFSSVFSTVSVAASSPFIVAKAESVTDTSPGYR